MRIGLYGMPCAGKSYMLSKIDFIRTISGSETMKMWFPEFDKSNLHEKMQIRKQFAARLLSEPEFIMDGHYAFGDDVVFTEEDGRLYDVFLYLYIDPLILQQRMQLSERNRKYSKTNLTKWQQNEMEGLRSFCHEHKKDFYILDNPSLGYFEDIAEPVRFIRDICNGFSCRAYAECCARDILRGSAGSKEIVLTDGDKTLSAEDTCGIVWGYETDLFDGNFYTGYQSWRNDRNIRSLHDQSAISDIPDILLNEEIVRKMLDDSYILTCGSMYIWKKLSAKLNMKVFGGNEMSADTKYFITRCLRDNGKYVKAYGDSMSDYFMLKEADEGYMIVKNGGAVSRSLKDRDLEGLQFVRTEENGGD